MTLSRKKSVQHSKEMIARREAQREVMCIVGFYVNNLAEAEEAVASLVINKQSLPPLYKVKARIRNTYKAHKDQGYTYSHESYQCRAAKKTWKLQQYGRIPNKEFVLHSAFWEGGSIWN